MDISVGHNGEARGYDNKLGTVALTNVTRTTLVPLRHRYDPAGLAWLQRIDVETSPADDRAILRVHTTEGYAEVTITRIRENTVATAPWCTLCRRRLAPVSAGSGAWAHASPGRVDNHAAVPASLAGRLVMSVPHTVMPLAVNGHDGTTEGRVLEAPVLEVSPGRLLLGNI